jgi:membrane-bound ClpP family serine protease
MIVLGLILLIVGYILPIPILETLGIILIVIGLILLLLGGVGHPVAGRRYWW